MHPRLNAGSNKTAPNHYDFDTFKTLNVPVPLGTMKENLMQKLKKKGKVMFALEIVLYLAIAIAVSLAIIL